MAEKDDLSPENPISLPISSSSTVIAPSGRSSTFDFPRKAKRTSTEQGDADPVEQDGTPYQGTTASEKFSNDADDMHYSEVASKSRKAFSRKVRALFTKGGKIRPFRLLRQDVRNIRKRYVSDWTLFNQLVFASAVFVFFTNILPGITFASDLYARTGMTWGTIEIVFSTGLCGTIFAL